MLIAQCFTGESTVRKEHVIIINVAVITPVCWYNENSFCLGVWLQRGEET